MNSGLYFYYQIKSMATPATGVPGKKLTFRPDYEIAFFSTFM